MPNSDPPATTPQGEAAPKKKSKFKLIMLLLAVLLLLGGGGGGAYWFLTKDSDFSLFSFFGSDENSAAITTSSNTSVTSGNTTNTGTSGTINPGISQIVSLPTLTVNLTDPVTPRYLRIGIDVEVSSADAVTAINNQTAKIRDAIIILLSSKTYSQLATADGKLQLKNEIAARINQILNVPRVVQIYFTDFVIQ